MWWQIVITIAVALYSYANAPKPQPRKRPELGDVKIPNAEVGREIPIVFGTEEITGVQILDFFDVEIREIRGQSGKK